MVDRNEAALVGFALLILYIAIKDVIRPLIELRGSRNGNGAKANGNGTVRMIEIGALVRQANEQLTQLMQELRQTNELIRQLLVEQKTSDHDLRRSVAELLRSLPSGR